MCAIIGKSQNAVWANCEVAGGCGISLSSVRVADNPLKEALRRRNSVYQS
jgi:hypothetical protein